MKKTLLTLILMLASGSVCAQSITIGDDTIVRCKDVPIGTKQTISGTEYEVVDRDLLITRRGEGSDLTKVCVSNVTDMSSMFLNSTSFNQAIGNWDVSSVTNMFSMFSGSSFNQSLDNWDVNSVTDMSGLFLSSLFNQPLDNWNVSNVLFMDHMFYQSQFNQDIGDWDVSSVTNMDYMFTDSSFNQPINSLWFSIVVEGKGSNNNNSLIGYFSSTDGIINLFYNSTDFTNNLLLPIKITHNDSDSDNKIITLSENPSSYAFTENGIIIKSDGSDIFGDEITELALFTDNNNNSRVSFYNENDDEWNTLQQNRVSNFNITLISDPRAGAVSATNSTVVASPATDVVADGVATSTITVTLKDANNNPVPGKTVGLADNSDTSTISEPSGSSSASGVVTFTVGNTIAETVTYTATGDDVVIAGTATVAFILGAATQIAVNAGNNQSATVGTALATAPSVIVRDANDNPVSGVSVTFAVASGGGSATDLTATTNASGIATVGSWTLGTTAGSNTLTATSTGLTGSPLTLTATGFSPPGAPTINSLTAGYQQITVAFTAPSDNGGITITNYEYNLNNSDTWILFSPASTTSPFTIIGLSNDATYSIQLRAVNNGIYGLASEAMSATPRNITVTITDLERYSFADSNGGEPTKTILNAVTFPGVNGDFEGSGDFEGPDLNASFGLNDRIVMRFVPPAGSFFAVKKHPDAAGQIFGVDAVWQEGASGSTTHFSSLKLDFENLTGTAPNVTFGNTNLSDNGHSLVAQFTADVTSDFTFTALEISFSVSHDVVRTNTAYGSVRSGSSPSFGVRASGPENLKDMALFSVVGEPVKLAFTSSTENLTSGIKRQLIVEVRDAEGDLVVNDNGRSITFSKTSRDGTVTDLGSATTTSGIATLTVTGESSGEITIGAIASDLDSASTAFAIIAGAASSLAFVAQPSNAVIGASIGSIAVEILDENGNRTTDNSSSVTLSIANNVGSATLSGTVTVNAVSGLATFNELSINKVGAGYALSAAWSGPTVGTSSAFNVTAKPLTIADPMLTRIKIYDGNTTAAITAGEVPGVLLGDDVTITTVANYDNSGVDTDKTITVVYTLAGADASKYTAPANFVANDGVITSKQLTIGDPTLTRSKAFDNTTSAAVTAGSLSGVETGDVVTVSAVASYDTATTGTVKTITVVYTLAGADASKYTAPANFVANDGVITTKALTVTADADQSKLFGATDLILTYALSAEVPVTGALARAEGENVGGYAITIGTLSAGDNYTTDFKGGDFGITAIDFANSTFSIDTIADQTQTGSIITPSVVVGDGTVTLLLDTDYTVAYTNNTDVGTVRVTVTGRGNYSGTLEEEFLIVAAPADPEAVPISVNGGPGLLALIALLWWLSMRHLSFSATRANSHRRLR